MAFHKISEFRPLTHQVCLSCCSLHTLIYIPTWAVQYGAHIACCILSAALTLEDFSSAMEAILVLLLTCLKVLVGKEPFYEYINKKCLLRDKFSVIFCSYNHKRPWMNSLHILKQTNIF